MSPWGIGRACKTHGLWKICREKMKASNFFSHLLTHFVARLLFILSLIGVACRISCILATEGAAQNSAILRLQTDKYAIKATLIHFVRCFSFLPSPLLPVLPILSCLFLFRSETKSNRIRWFRRSKGEGTVHRGIEEEFPTDCSFVLAFLFCNRYFSAFHFFWQ